MNRIKWWIAIVLVGLVTVVVIQNTDPVVTRLLFATVEMPHAALLAVTFAVGVLVGYLLRLKAAARAKS